MKGGEKISPASFVNLERGKIQQRRVKLDCSK